MNRLYLVAVLLGAVALSGCQGPPSSGQALADAQTREACRQRADQAYEVRNRDEIYSPPASVNTPYSANYVPDSPEAGLSELYAHDQMISDCVRNTGTGTERSVPDSAAAPTPAPAAH